LCCRAEAGSPFHVESHDPKPKNDFGFAWTPHGTYARDLAHFEKLLGFTAHESIIAATYGVAKLMMRDNEMGQVKAGNYADCILVDGNPLEEIEVLQDHDKLNVIMINGRVHKAGRKEYETPPVTSVNGDGQGVLNMQQADGK
jgi:predicted amidohydrolase YtcJ